MVSYVGHSCEKSSKKQGAKMDSLESTADILKLIESYKV